MPTLYPLITTIGIAFNYPSLSFYFYNEIQFNLF